MQILRNRAIKSFQQFRIECAIEIHGYFNKGESKRVKKS